MVFNPIPIKAKEHFLFFETPPNFNIWEDTVNKIDILDEREQELILLRAEVRKLRVERSQLLDELESTYKTILSPTGATEDLLSLQAENEGLNVELEHRLQLLEERNEELQVTTYQVMKALAESIEGRDDNTAGHCDRLVRYSLVLGKELGMENEQLESLVYGSLLHDIGKISIPDSILMKNGPLTQEEYAHMKKHTIIGWKLIQPLRLMAEVAKIIRHHHERFDGTGYPDALAGEEIPLAARILGLVDVFDALTTVRPYKSAFDLEYSLEIIRNEGGRHFDPTVVEAFFNALDKKEIILGEYELPEELLKGIGLL